MTAGFKVRIGVAAGVGVADDAAAFLDLVDAVDDLGYDSIWVPDVVTTSTLDPIAALSVAAGRRHRLKLGTHLILPGRNPVLLAKQLATLDQLSGGRVLINAVLGLRQPAELAAQGVDAGERTRMLEESMHIMRTLWRGEPLTFAGTHHRYEDVQLAVRPKQQPLEMWLGGQVPAALRRCGRIGEGWMPGLCTPAEAAAGKAVIDAAAEEAGRTIDREHFGVNLTWVERSISPAVRASVAARRDDLDADDVIAIGVAGLAEQIEAFLAVGFSKFVIRPAEPPSSWPSAIEGVADVLELQT
ncbi:MAG: LLM class flavin-dependent oxidoreductase [Acidimicrobiales bacterium]